MKKRNATKKKKGSSAKAANRKKANPLSELDVEFLSPYVLACGYCSYGSMPYGGCSFGAPASDGSSGCGPVTNEC